MLRLLFVIGVAITTAIIGCEVEVPLDVPPQDASIGSDGGGGGSGFDGSSSGSAGSDAGTDGGGSGSQLSDAM